MTKCVDDPFLWSDDLQSSFFQAVGWLNLCGCNVMASPSTRKSSSLGRKKSFLQDLKWRWTMWGHVRISWRSLLVFQCLLTSKMPVHGLVYNRFNTSYNQAYLFIWSNQINDLFLELKLATIYKIENGITIFDKTNFKLVKKWFRLLNSAKTLCLPTNPFSCKTGWKATLVVYKSTSKAESRYAPIEDEAIAVVDVLDEAAYFVLNCTDLMICIDYKPLLKVFADQSPNGIPNPSSIALKRKQYNLDLQSFMYQN